MNETAFYELEKLKEGWALATVAKATLLRTIGVTTVVSEDIGVM
jgi:hypothetical protein